MLIFIYDSYPGYLPHRFHCSVSCWCAGTTDYYRAGDNRGPAADGRREYCRKRHSRRDNYGDGRIVPVGDPGRLRRAQTSITSVILLLCGV